MDNDNEIEIIEIPEVDIDRPEDIESTNIIVKESEPWPERLMILPLSNRPLFPGLVVPLVYEGDELMELIRTNVEQGHQYVGLVLVKDEEEPLKAENLFRVGVLARIRKMIEIENQGLHLVVEGLERFEAYKWHIRKQNLQADVHYHIAQPYEDSDDLRAYTVAIINTIKELLKHNPLHEEAMRVFASRFSVNQPEKLADFAAGLTTAGRDELQDVLETFSIFERMKKVMTLLNRELNVSKVQHRIRSNIDERVSEQQRKYFLQEQLREIRQELGLDSDPRALEMDKLKARAKSLKFSKEAQQVFNEELLKLEMIDPSAPDYAVSRNYLDWLVSLPWGIRARDRLSLPKVARSLNRHHAGLEDIKERILEFIAVGGRKNGLGGSIVLFVGPPGVGKTSLGRAIADAIHRPFYRFSVGGMRDEAEIKGHRRTYIGAMPGKIIQALKQVEVENPVIMIDEVDKMGADFRGDPASALLEVLDPEQNVDFMDHYLDVRFDLSKVLFLLTANQLDTVPEPLLDRAEIIRLPGYITEEKVDIARKHLLPHQLIEHGFEKSDVKMTASTLKYITENYAREPGVRQLEQLLKKILRKIAHQVAMNHLQLPMTVTIPMLKAFIGKPRFMPEALRCEVGLSTGLAWTAMGGVSLVLEALLIHHDKRGLKVTGQLGKVMQESAEIAYSYVTANLTQFGVSNDFFDHAFIHLHVPEGAVPKDGPSAGITIASALLSLARTQKTKPMAMTGELTLTGEVLPIGGVREKLIAAKRLGITEVILPAANEVDVEELPDSVAEHLTLHYAKHYAEVFALLF
ncbi:MAG: endopeptidase La [Zetaproteobacteria bacterium]|nr:endopeptidase La [Zetaproteobacteria bacterium]